MAHVYLNRDGSEFTVRVFTGSIGDRTTRFTDRDAALAFALKKMGGRGMILDTTQMTAEQLAAHQAREQRSRELLQGLGIADRMMLDNGRAYAPRAVGESGPELVRSDIPQRPASRSRRTGGRSA